MPLRSTEWREIERPGYLGKRRDERFAQYDLRFGSRQNWALGWKVAEQIFNQEEVCLLYAQAYYEFFRHHWSILNELVSEASEVYDDEESNVASGLDFTKQETARTHLQDIAIRRAIILHGRWFEGGKLIRIRQEKGDHRLSMVLSPGRVPFHKRQLILRPSLAEQYPDLWWQADTVEDFYQTNRVVLQRIQLKKARLNKRAFSLF